MWTKTSRSTPLKRPTARAQHDLSNYLRMIADIAATGGFTHFLKKKLVLNSLPNSKILDSSKLEAFTEYKIIVTQKLEFDAGGINPIPNKPWFLRVSNTNLLKTLWEMGRLLVTTSFSLIHSVLYPFL